MSHKPITERSAWKRAEQVRASGADAAERIRSRRDLSDAGRRRQLAAIHKATRDRLAELRRADRDEQIEQQQQRATALFQPRKGRDAMTVMADRDAASRVASIATPDQARRMLAAAIDNEDQSLARALARHATVRHDASSTLDQAAWDEVIHEWADSGLAPMFARTHLAEMVAASAEMDDAQLNMAASAHFSPRLPPELAGQGHRVDQLAAEADEQADKIAKTEAEQYYANLHAYNDAG